MQPPQWTSPSGRTRSFTPRSRRRSDTVSPSVASPTLVAAPTPATCSPTTLPPQSVTWATMTKILPPTPFLLASLRFTLTEVWHDLSTIIYPDGATWVWCILLLSPFSICCARNSHILGRRECDHNPFWKACQTLTWFLPLHHDFYSFWFSDFFTKSLTHMGLLHWNHVYLGSSTILCQRRHCMRTRLITSVTLEAQ